MQLNVLNYYYNLQVYKYFDLLRTILYHANEIDFKALCNETFQRNANIMYIFIHQCFILERLIYKKCI